jgi:hypothetical protein
VRDTAHESSSPSLVPVVVGGALFAAGLATGVGFHFAAAADSRRADELRADMSAGSCTGGPGAPAGCAALRDAAAERDHHVNLSTAGFVVAAVALVATPAYWFLWPAPARQDTGSVRVSGGAGPQGGELRLIGEF